MQPSFLVLIERNFPALRQKCRSGPNRRNAPFARSTLSAWLQWAVQAGAPRCPSGREGSRRDNVGCPPLTSVGGAHGSTLKTIPVHRFDHRANWPAKTSKRVRNVSKVGSTHSVSELPP